MKNEEITVKMLQDKVSDILQTTDWYTKDMPPDVVMKMIEIRSSLVRLSKKLEDAREILKPIGEH